MDNSGLLSMLKEDKFGEIKLMYSLFRRCPSALGDLKNESVRSVLDFESIHDRGKFTFELHVNNGADNLGNLSCGGAENACETINVSVTSGGEFELTLRSKPGQHL